MAHVLLDGEVAAVLERVRANTYEDRDYDTDGMNARFLEEGRRTDLPMARSQFLAARARAREAMEALSDLTAPVEEWFSETAYKHIDDQLPEVRRFVSQLDRPTQP